MKKGLLVFALALLVLLSGCPFGGMSWQEGAKKIEAINVKYGVGKEKLLPDSLQDVKAYIEELNGFLKEVKEAGGADEKALVLYGTSLKEFAEMKQNFLKAKAGLKSSGCGGLQKATGLFDDAVAAAKNSEAASQQLLSAHSFKLGAEKEFVESVSSSASALSESIKGLKDSVEQYCAG